MPHLRLPAEQGSGGLDHRLRRLPGSPGEQVRCVVDDEQLPRGTRFLQQGLDLLGTSQLVPAALHHGQRTAELRTSHERLARADRLASIGTLTAGLGHDMNNLLFPLRCRLDALDWSTVPDGCRNLLRSVGDTVKYLQQLTDGLRLFESVVHDVAAGVSVP